VTHIVDSLRNESMGRALIVVDDQLEIVDECWAEAEPWALESAPSIALSQLAPSSEGASVKRVVVRDDFPFNPQDEIGVRPQRDSWLLAGGLIALFLWFALWTRRSELGIYRALGCRPTHLIILTQIEVAVSLLLGFLLGTLWGVVVSGMLLDVALDLDRLRFVLWVPLMGALFAAVLAPIGLLSSSASIQNLLKDR
jgi:hypothetical protein